MKLPKIDLSKVSLPQLTIPEPIVKYFKLTMISVFAVIFLSASLLILTANDRALTKYKKGRVLDGLQEQLGFYDFLKEKRAHSYFEGGHELRCIGNKNVFVTIHLSTHLAYKNGSDVYFAFKNLKKDPIFGASAKKCLID